MANKLNPIGKSSLGMDENLAALLAYVTIVGGLVFFFVEKESKFVKFNAMQSSIMGAGWIVIWVASRILGNIPFIGFLFVLLTGLIGLGYFILSIIMMIKAYQGEWLELPVIGKIAMEQANK